MEETQGNHRHNTTPLHSENQIIGPYARTLRVPLLLKSEVLGAVEVKFAEFALVLELN